ncbi:T9SS type A sorting domain-containing protein [Flavobacteriaceae bacterium S0825]|uniref:T9SS type A sorting domain-containing protein n=1 Tax=Gaetbulibacter sp. S0825 TaxID=2720084 RepID=UPI001431F658|nr:T9SS type A sorting domain-containing protein [Gaetbulibacter sp. S0825]MCK0108107.1 T9SS type A sorting domain-containing protein [Flavobacteriaceae bacterium S0825]NIX63743.1 T9SS type A sorting domain-containing protein [Gaetbulibacter sp. S0825]
MKYKITFILLFWALYFSYGQTIFSNEITDTDPSADNPYTNGQYVDPNITVSGIGRGPGLTRVQSAHGVNTYAAYNFWTNRFHVDDYFEFVLTPNSGYEIDFINFIYTGRTSAFFATPPTNIVVRSSLDGFTNDIGTPTLTGNNIIDLTGAAYQNITSAITFRVYAWGGAPSGIFGIDDFEFNGSVNPIPCYGGITTTWNGSSWDNGIPNNLTTTAIIDGNYTTSTSGSFIACNLTITAGNTLTIANGDFIEIEHDIIADGTINVRPQGSVKQNDDDGIVAENGLIHVTKRTSLLNNWYEYTYWSSPVLGETIGSGLSESQPDRRFSYNGANFLDTTKETDNNNDTVNGQDDIDDNGDDWEFVNGATVMTPGVGYASTHSQALFIGPPNATPPYQFDYIFKGPFNNGVITVPVYRNDSETNDNNWNLIGNPYPSAIDADLFLGTNSTIATNIPHNAALDGALFLWSQNTAPSNTANGNENENFAVSDYAVINTIGQTAGGDGEIPSRNIPSGQGFFVVYSDVATPDTFLGDIKQGTVIFNNSMRVTGNNNQFFRTSNKTNKLWLNLTSDNGVFNQILVAYAKGASDGYDGMAYDTPKNLASGASAILYSTIENETKKFVIQGKSENSISTDEIINVGYKTSINVPTIYTLSISQLEGDFLSSNTIYLKDNLLNRLHDLKASDYNFTSEVGEFDNRFQIVFSEALFMNNALLNKNSLSIFEHKNGDIQFKLNASNKMNNIKIIDLQGRILYNFDINGNDEIFKLSNLSQAPYFAKVTLDNNYVITKKALKK